MDMIVHGLRIINKARWLLSILARGKPKSCILLRGNQYNTVGELNLSVIFNFDAFICSNCISRWTQRGIHFHATIFILNSKSADLCGLRNIEIAVHGCASLDKGIEIAFLPSLCSKCCKLRQHIYNQGQSVCSSICWFNLTSGSDIALDCTVRVKGPLFPQTAQEIQVALIKSSNYDENSVFDSELIEYFQQPRLLAKDDIISVKSKCADDNLKFKVIKIFSKDCTENENFYVDNKNSRLLQIAPISFRSPQTVELCVSMDIQFSYANQYLQKLVNTFNSWRKLRGFKKFQKSTSLLPLLIHGPSGCGKVSLCKSAAALLHLHVIEFQIDSYEIISDTSGASETKIRNVFERAVKYAPCTLIFKNVEVMFQEANSDCLDARAFATWECCLELTSDYPILVLATSQDRTNLHSQLMATFAHSIQIMPLNLNDRKNVLNCLLPKLVENELEEMGEITAGFLISDLIDVCHECTFIQSKSHLSLLQSFRQSLDSAKSSHAFSIGAPTVFTFIFITFPSFSVPNVLWTDVGGLEMAKKDIMDTILMPRKHAQLFKSNILRRSGILLHGPPGCGKTLLAKAVASQCKLTFLSVKGPELLNMYVGQSERNVRQIFEKARTASPCIIFMDELDSLAPNRGRAGDSGGVMDRIVSQLLAELDGMDTAGEVYVIGATNRPDLIDPALLRPGRFDKLVYVGLNNDPNSKLKILEAQTSKIPLSAHVSLEYLARICPNDLSGADIYWWVSEACQNAIRDCIWNIERLGDKEKFRKIVVEERHFLDSLGQLMPSVNESDVIKYGSMADTL